MRSLTLLTCALLALAATASSAHAEAPSPGTIPAPDLLTDVRLTQRTSCCPPRCLPNETPCGPCRWTFHVSLSGWLAGMDGDLTVGGNKTGIESSPGDTLQGFLDHGERLFQGNITASYGRWGVRFGGMTMRLGGEVDATNSVAGRRVSADLGLDLAQVDVSYCIKRCQIGSAGGCPATLAYEAYAGLRYFYLEAELGITGGAGAVTGRQTKEFVDPLIGGRVTWDLGNRWSFDLEADIGGFGVGSEFSWQVRGGARYRVARWFSAEVGLRVLDIDYVDGSGANRFAWDITMWGPYIAFGFHF